MRNKAKVKFWLDGQILFIQNQVTKEIKIIKNGKKIAMFLNAHRLTVHDLKGVMYGYDVLNLFWRRHVISPFKFVQL